MATIAKPYTFSASTTASSSQVNANFDTIYDDYNGGISAANLATGAVTTPKIADDAVTVDKIADSAVTPAQLLTGTGSSWAWQSWTPSYTNFTVGNGTLAHAKYTQIGKTVFFRWKFTYGSTTTSADPPVVSLPVTPASTVAINLAPMDGGGGYYDSSGGVVYSLVLLYRTTGVTGVEFLAQNASATYLSEAGVSATTPVAPGASDEVTINGSYEAA